MLGNLHNLGSNKDIQLQSINNAADGNTKQGRIFLQTARITKFTSHTALNLKRTWYLNSACS